MANQANSFYGYASGKSNSRGVEEAFLQFNFHPRSNEYSPSGTELFRVQTETALKTRNTVGNTGPIYGSAWNAKINLDTARIYAIKKRKRIKEMFLK